MRWDAHTNAIPSAAPTGSAMVGPMPAAPGRPIEVLSPIQTRTLRRAVDAEREAERKLNARRVLTRNTISALRKDGASMAAIAREMGVSRQTLYDRIGEPDPG